MGLFGKSGPTDPKEQVNEWCHKIRKEGYQLDRQIRAIQREEEKVKRSLKEAAKKGDKSVCIVLAKEVVRARKAINKIYTSKAHLNSIQMQMKNQLATLRVAGSLQKSTEVMQAMQRLIKVPEVAATMREMSKEMMRAGIIEEMLEDTMSSIEDPEEMEEEAQEEVDKVLWELTAGALGQAPAAVTDNLPAGASRDAAAASIDVDDEQELEEMQSRLQALRS
ncbi:charged multivesicular body protein 3 [Nilaparvata lugens]|uniref:charged multivesicular body protein 3 n=1 Tax=Nilaparvata lugens TaxID=108931 RepID=UPI000B99313C|nr:charged multivesicular body protein 3 [Nilaparvata lugens]XP_039287608.1 charged multivesicular body protein 3 [Nilaparvata lugens]XP_039287616.1 charged multivesicular body protein 3 [Nilaparvata lugens]XP_039287624.1 charged multivesicular body protein 3 [Nilaparvata lugens]XP_039287635.1 charged multivesicular body protein 3 [Nilaparvata lugens]XP_039287646.1 charged multivesicular body protein 3 [Nilaparvata lugens]